jgi:hypothetical protein
VPSSRSKSTLMSDTGYVLRDLGNVLHNHKQIRVLQNFPQLPHELQHQLFKKEKKYEVKVKVFWP